MFTWFLIIAPRSPLMFWNWASFCRVPKNWKPGGEAVAAAEERRGPEVAQLGAVGVRRVVDDGEGQRVVEVLIVELGRPLEGLVLADRRAQGEGAARVVVVARLLGETRRRVLLLRVLLELLRRQRARELLLVVNVAEVEAERGASGEDVAGGAERAVPRLLAVIPIALQLRVG